MTIEHLADRRLFRQSAYIDGYWIESPETISVDNPSNGKQVGTIPALGKHHAQLSIDAAYKAQPDWAAQTAKQRSDILRRWFELIMEHQDDLGIILTLEQGKPLAEAKGEIAYGASFIEWFSEETRRVEGDILAGHAQDKRLMVLKHQSVWLQL